jgi:hypothetical protein
MRPDPFLLAHGSDPGPTQRPTLAGCLAGIAATVPALPILLLLGSLGAEARILNVSVPATIAGGAACMALAGSVYGRILGRAANDRHGGWLFGMAFGFLVWAAGAMMVLPVLSDGYTLGGPPAIGVLLGLLVWGTAFGALFPVVHRRVHVRLDRLSAESMGEGAAGAMPPTGLRRPVPGPSGPSA